MTEPITVHLDRRELGTVLAALRFHQDKNLRSDADVPDGALRDVATDAGVLIPLSFQEVSKLCEKLNCSRDVQGQSGLAIGPPPEEGGDETLFRVVYVIDVGAANPLAAAEEVYRIMTDPDSLPPVLDVMDHCGKVTRIDLSDPGNAGRKGECPWATNRLPT